MSRTQDRLLIADIIVQVPAKAIDQTFSYRVPSGLQDVVQVGSRVVVSFGKRKVQGYVLDLNTASTAPQEHVLKDIEAVLDDLPPLTAELIELGQWMSQEYVCLQIVALQAMLPSVLKSKTIKKVTVDAQGQRQVDYEIQDRKTRKTEWVIRLSVSLSELDETLAEWPKRGQKQKQVLHFISDFMRTAAVAGDDHDLDLVEQPLTLPLKEVLTQCATSRSVVQALEKKGLIKLEEREVLRDPYAGHHFQRSEPLPLTNEQRTAYEHIVQQIERQEHRTFLVHGVTGSGKTEIYLQSIAHVLQQGKEAIVLVPEISLTPQMVERFKARFGAQVAVLHSRLSAGERYDEWRKIQEQQATVVIGARSALFAPMRNLGLIIVDEEHESSYKQEENPRYHARDVAIFRGEYHRIPVILGSATPTLESRARAMKDHFTLLPLHNRVLGQRMPTVEVVDMRAELRAGNRSIFSERLYRLMEECLARGEQMVLLLNRRGFSTFVMCRDCGYVLGCPHCDISLTYHKRSQAYRCHYCAYEERGHVSACPACHSEHIRFFGTGTQKVEEALQQAFPGMRVIRMDVDTTSRKGAHERLLSAFGRGEADCLLGTQMIAKGLDFERVTLVGVLAADAMLHLPDFRSAERTFQLLTQVSGRAGRHELPGKVVVQTYAPEHYSIVHAAKHDYEAFFQQEMHFRRHRGYPPYVYLSLITFAHEDLQLVVSTARKGATFLQKHLSTNSHILGPVASPIPRIKDRYRYHCMIKYKNEPHLSVILQSMLADMQVDMVKHGIHVTVDRHPQMLM